MSVYSRWISVLTSALIIAATVNVQSQEKLDPLEQAKHILCKLKGDVRTLQITKAEDGNCLVVYTKLGKDSIVANAKSFAYCQKIMNDIRKNLNTADWQCRDISGSSVMVSPETPKPADLVSERLPSSTSSPAR